MKSAKLILINVLIILVLAGGAVGGIWYYNNNTNYYKTDDARIAAPLASVTATAPGIVTKLLVNAGDKITAGQVVAQVKAQVAGQGGALQAVTLNVESVTGGTVISVPVKVGDLVAPGQAVANLADLEKVYISANVEETRIPDLASGQKVDITIDAYPDTTFTGKVDRVGDVTTSQLSILPSINASGNYTKVVQRVPVTITLDSSSGTTLKPGMNSTVSIHVK